MLNVMLRRKTTLRAFSSVTNPFPSLLISSGRLSAHGPFAEAQAEFLTPDFTRVEALGNMLREKNMGVVAHFYMDAELQGHLSAIKNWEHIFVSDSLAMGEEAVEMAKKGVTSIACLGVDFMSESVRATLNQNGFEHVKVFRLAEKEIGCSLAASAERAQYTAYLEQAAKAKNPLHVIYINTSMETKAKSNAIVPTITCTSSNVVRTILTAAIQVPEVSIWYGPDTYMGRNLEKLFNMMLTMTPEEIQEFHPDHTRETIADLLTRFNYFKQGICVVHHMFGGEVTQRVARDYPLDENTFHTAHFEVPGEMFELASVAQQRGKGVVGSTSNILNFIVKKTKEAAAKNIPKVRFILGTESGMVTGIVREVQAALPKDSETVAEIIFPVASEAVSTTGEEGELSLVPGVKGGEGCSTAGGCASCPFMKMNELDALFDLAENAPVSWDNGIPEDLAKMQPRTKDGTVNEVPIVVAGAVPIQHMRHLMRTGHLSDELVEHITKKYAVSN